MATKVKAPVNGATPEVIEPRQPIKLRRLKKVIHTVPIQGKTPLIVHAWDAKAKAIMLESQQTAARAKKQRRDPVADFEASRYRMADGSDGFPANGFKAAISDAARHYDGLTIVDTKIGIYVIGEGASQLVKIDGEVSMREDTVRIGSGTTDLRYRAQFWPWSAVLHVEAIERMFDPESLLALVDAAGIGGIGEWRPSAPKAKSGTFGMFEVPDSVMETYA